jgi:hypothetical protein
VQGIDATLHHSPVIAVILPHFKLAGALYKLLSEKYILSLALSIR